ncbi:MAG: DNA polymerase III subunit delta [Elusimicrobiota bacterium]
MPTLRYYELKSKLKVLKKSDVSPIYLFYGNEDYLKYYTINCLEKILIEPSVHDLNYSVFHIHDKNEKQSNSAQGKNSIFEDAISSANSIPFMSDKKMVIVKNIHKLPESQDELFEKYIKNPHTSTCLILVGADKLPKREIFIKIEELFPTVNFYNLFDNDICLWIIEYVKTFGKSISSDRANKILKVTGNNLFDIKNETDKLILYVGSKTEIETDDIQDCCGYFKENTVFELTSALVEEKIEEAIEVLINLLDSGEDEYMILAYITDRYRKYLRFIEFTENGFNDKEAAIRCGVRFFQNEFIKNAQKFDNLKINFLLTKILETDVKMKSSSNSKNHIERLVFDICNYSRFNGGLLSSNRTIVS